MRTMLDYARDVLTYRHPIKKSQWSMNDLVHRAKNRINNRRKAKLARHARRVNRMRAK